jgi:hypothetical protein
MGTLKLLTDPNRIMFIRILALSLFTLPLIAAAGGNVSTSQNMLLAEMEVHSTAGIANRVQRRDAQPYEYDPAFEESSPYLENDVAQEELPPPTTVEQISPTRSRVITRTTTRPSRQYPPDEGIGIAPVIAPIYDDGHHNRYPPPAGVSIDNK